MKTVGLVLTLVLMVGCAATQYPYATPHRAGEIGRMTTDPAGLSNKLAASFGRVQWVDRGPIVTRFGLLVDGTTIVADFAGQHADLYAGGSVSILYSPVKNVDGINAFGGPARALLVHAWAVNGVSGTVCEPWKRDEAEKWSKGTLFASR